MDLLIAANTVTQPNSDLAPATGTPGWATDGDPTTNTPATQAPAWHYNMMMAEMLAIVKAAGITPSNADWSQVLKAMQTIFAPAQRGVAPYSATLAQLIGGYPKYAIVLDAAGILWSSSADENTTVPGADGAAWQRLLDGFVKTPIDKSGNGTLAIDEFYYIARTGVLWINSYAADGTPISKQITCPENWKNYLSGNTGYRIAPDGKIEQWGVATLPASGSVTATASVSYLIAFPSICTAFSAIPTGPANTTLGCWPATAVVGLPGKASATVVADTLSHSGSAAAPFDQTVQVLWKAEGY